VTELGLKNLILIAPTLNTYVVQFVQTIGVTFGSIIDSHVVHVVRLCVEENLPQEKIELNTNTLINNNHS